MLKIFCLIAKLENCKNLDFLTDGSKALSLLKEMASEINTKIFSEHVYEFDPGISAIIIVGESHFALHSWPELKSAYFVATICKKVDLKKGLEFLKEKLGAEKIGEKYFEI